MTEDQVRRQIMQSELDADRRLGECYRREVEAMRNIHRYERWIQKGGHIRAVAEREKALRLACTA